MAVRKALENAEVATSQPFQGVVSLLAAYPAGCSEQLLARFGLLESFHSFPPLARRELIVRRAEGYTLRYLLEEDRPPEQVEQRLTQEFVARYAPGAKYTKMAASGFLDHVLMSEVFGSDWRTGERDEQRRAGVTYLLQKLTGTFDPRYPDRRVTLALTSVQQSQAPDFEKLDPEAEIELRFEFNYGLLPTEPSQLIVAAAPPGRCRFPVQPQRCGSGGGAANPARYPLRLLRRRSDHAAADAGSGSVYVRQLR